MNWRRLLSCAVVSAAAVVGAHSGYAQSNAFTYQGRTHEVSVGRAMRLEAQGVEGAMHEKGDADHRSEIWLRSELFLGLSTRAGAPISERQWRAFVARNVTPRFPDGLTILDARGQWKDPQRGLRSEPSHVIVILYPKENARQADESLTQIARAYVAQFDQEYVLRCDSEASTQFYTRDDVLGKKRLAPGQGNGAPGQHFLIEPQSEPK